MYNATDILLLDGPTGTELQCRGVDTTLPLWSARALQTAPDVVEQIHLDYIDAGADVITANSFRTNRRAVERSGVESSAEELTRLSVEIARRAVERSGRTDILVAGSDAPVEDCYTPELVPTDDELRSEHAEHIQWLVNAGCDFILIETMNTLREAVAACEAASALASPFMVSVVTDNDGAKILGGESLREAIERLHHYRPLAILANCSSPRAVLRAVEILSEMRTALGAAWRFGGYANSGEPDPVVGWHAVMTVPVDAFTDAVKEMMEHGATVIGSCCGTTPAYTRQLDRLRKTQRTSEGEHGR